MENITAIEELRDTDLGAVAGGGIGDVINDTLGGLTGVALPSSKLPS